LVKDETENKQIFEL